MRDARCSSLPLLMACPASAHGEMSVTETFEASADGSACHEVMALVVQGVTPDLDDIALRWGCDRDELGRLVWFGRKCWTELAPSFPDPETEVEVQAIFPGGGRLTGHIDLMSWPEDGKIHALDWKSGRKAADYYDQVAGYARCLFGMASDALKEVVITIVWLRDQAVETFSFTRESLRDWWERLCAVREAVNDFRTGPHCSFCPRTHDCPALLALVKRDVAMFTAANAEEALAAATPAQLVDIRRRAKLVSKFAEHVDDFVRSLVEQRGPIEAADGAILALVPENGKRVVDTAKAWPVLSERFDYDEMTRIASVSLTKVQEAAAEKAPDRGKGKAKKEIVDALTAAGAIQQGTVLKLKEVRKPREIT